MPPLDAPNSGGLLLINPPFQKQVRAVAQLSLGPPLGLAYLAAACLPSGRPVRLWDANAEGGSLGGLRWELEAFQPCYVGFTAVTPTVGLCHEWARAVKAWKPETVTLVGGVHVTVLPERTMEEFPAFDFGCIGEGDDTLPELLEVLDRGGDAGAVQGLVLRGGKRPFRTPDRPIRMDLDTLPLPARQFLPNHLYKTYDSDAFTVMVAMRGCPGHCNYCSTPILFGDGLRKRGAENLLLEIRQCVEEFGVKTLSFLDDTFTADREWAEVFCQAMITSGLNRRVRWLCLTRVDRVDRELLDLMKAAGCFKVEFGVESGDQKVLAGMRKGTTVPQVVEAFHMARKAGLQTFAFIMLNMPNETLESIRRTEDLISKIGSDYLQVSFATPYPGTKLERECREKGLLKEVGWEEYSFLNRILISNPNLPEEALWRAYRRITRRFYLRPRFLWRAAATALSSPGRFATMTWASLVALPVVLFGRRSHVLQNRP